MILMILIMNFIIKIMKVLFNAKNPVNIKKHIQVYFNMYEMDSKMIVHEAVREFIHWLHANKLYGKFFANFIYSTQAWKESHDTPAHWYSFIEVAFLWESTYEGHEFWLNKHEEWNDYVRRNNKWVLNWD